jgi:nitrite reductase/ring-hydroxylating ferredoxin subunit
MATSEMTLHGLSLDLSGWFQVGWSNELEPGDVLAKHYFGRDLVVYRGLDGVVHVHDRYCQHLGASLARGGCVTGDGLQCPFHGWVWGLATSEGRSFRAMRRWTTQFYPGHSEFTAGSQRLREGDAP